MRTFKVVRDVDVTGISGTGIVAEGVEFSDGNVALRWGDIDHESPNYQRGVRPTTVLHESVHSVEALHGHGGATHVEFDPDYANALNWEVTCLRCAEQLDEFIKAEAANKALIEVTTLASKWISQGRLNQRAGYGEADPLFMSGVRLETLGQDILDVVEEILGSTLVPEGE